MALVGARGASEFWARSSYYDNISTNNLAKTNGIGASNSKTISIAIAFNTLTSGSYEPLLKIGEDNVNFGGLRFILYQVNTGLNLRGWNLSGQEILNMSIVNAVPSTSIWQTALISLDMNTADVNTVNSYINRVSLSKTATVFTNDTIKLTDIDVRVGAERGNPYHGYISSLYFTTDYIDFSQESNRNLFVNQLGYVRDLTPEIEAGNIPTPLFYLKFDDTSNLGIDSSGNNNHFTVNGTVTAGSDFTL